MHYDLWARDSCIGGALRSDFGGAGLHRYECSDRQRDDKPDVRFGANTDHDKTWRRADLENAANFELVLDDRIIDVGPPLVRPGRCRAS